jgi:glycosyltransferase involved in cell wall biosynthesis
MSPMGSEPIRVAFFYRDLPGEAGMPAEIQAFIRTLGEQGQWVWGFGYGSADDEQVWSERVRLLTFKRPRLFLKIPRGLKTVLSDLVNRKRLDVMFIVGGHILENYAIARWCRRNHLPYYFSPGAAYTPALLTRRKRLLKKFWKLFEVQILSWAHAIRAYSATNEQQIRQYFSSGLIFQLREGINDREVTGADEAKQFPRDTVNILYLGRIDVWGKGLDQLVEAIAILRREALPVFLHIVGPVMPQEAAGFQELLRRLPAGSYQYYGPVYGPERFTLFRAADLFAYTSRHEGIPRATREALALGVPLLVTAETNMAEDVVAYQAGLTVGCEADEIADKVRKFVALSPEQRLVMRRNASRLAKTLYQWPVIGAEFIRICEQHLRPARD